MTALAEAPQHTLDELAETFIHEHELCVEAGRPALTHAFNAGEALLAAKAQCEVGAWAAWCTENVTTCSRGTSQTYMRLAMFRSELQGAHVNTIMAALEFLREHDLRNREGCQIVQLQAVETRKAVLKLVAESVPKTAIAQQLGISINAVKKHADPDYRRRQRVAAARSKKLASQAKKALSREVLTKSMKRIGGSTDITYASIRKALESAQRVREETADRDVRLNMDAVLAALYQAEDKLADAMGFERAAR